MCVPPENPVEWGRSQKGTTDADRGKFWRRPEHLAWQLALAIQQFAVESKSKSERRTASLRRETASWERFLRAVDWWVGLPFPELTKKRATREIWSERQGSNKRLLARDDREIEKPLHKAGASPAVSHAANSGDRRSRLDARTGMTSSVALAQSLSLLACPAGYSVLHAKAEEFDLGRSPHCLNPMFARICSSYRLTTLFLLNPSCALCLFEPFNPPSIRATLRQSTLLLAIHSTPSTRQLSAQASAIRPSFASCRCCLANDSIPDNQ